MDAFTYAMVKLGHALGQTLDVRTSPVMYTPRYEDKVIHKSRLYLEHSVFRIMCFNTNWLSVLPSSVPNIYTLNVKGSQYYNHSVIKTSCCLHYKYTESMYTFTIHVHV